ncbi:hypothetical protein Taro_012508 [Colocasia esculenta]|uniref:protein-serine/threonine phosphatase n=1 Tax=Colocasia esculenta TaxID=4460 RepID=A0A843U994_COLES|nr:hypothetical protein [Colocasia esculenta]
MPVRLLLLLLLLFWLAPPPSSAAETSTCLTVYREGGAPAVFRSPSCPRWTLFHDEDHGRGRRHGPVSNCQMATHQGRRRSMEDRAVCALDVRIPFIGKNGLKEEVSVGIVAVFDGHNGAEASEMASQLLVDYFFLHVYFLLDGAYSSTFRGSAERLAYKGEGDVMLQGIHLSVGQGQHKVDPGRFKWILPKPLDGTLLIEILRESLLRAIHDIDATFYKENTEASRKSLESGSTATIVLIVEGQILVANVGDSKAIMCSESLYTPHEFKDRDEEKKRVEAAGGFVKDWAGVPRVNGELAVSRAIGDIPYKK